MSEGVFMYVCVEALVLSERGVFFPLCEASGWGRVRRSSGEAQHGAGCFS